MKHEVNAMGKQCPIPVVMIMRQSVMRLKF